MDISEKLDLLIEKIDDVTDDDTIIVTDVGQHQLWAAQFYKFEKPRTLLSSGGLGTMGYSMGAAMGAKWDALIKPL